MIQCRSGTVHSTDRLLEGLGANQNDLMGIGSKLSDDYCIDAYEDEIVECQTVQVIIDLYQGR